MHCSYKHRVIIHTNEPHTFVIDRPTRTPRITTTVAFHLGPSIYPDNEAHWKQLQVSISTEQSPFLTVRARGSPQTSYMSIMAWLTASVDFIPRSGTQENKSMQTFVFDCCIHYRKRQGVNQNSTYICITRQRLMQRFTSSVRRWAARQYLDLTQTQDFNRHGNTTQGSTARPKYTTNEVTDKQSTFRHVWVEKPLLIGTHFDQNALTNWYHTSTALHHHTRQETSSSMKNRQPVVRFPLRNKFNGILVYVPQQ